MRPHPYFRPKGRHHLGLPYLGPYLLLAMGVVAVSVAVGLPSGAVPWVGVIAMATSLLIGLRELRRPRDIPGWSWLVGIGVFVAIGVLLEVSEWFAVLAFPTGLLGLLWLHSRPPLDVVEVGGGRWEAVRDVQPSSTWPATPTATPQPYADVAPPAYEVAPPAAAARSVEAAPAYVLPTPDPRMRPLDLPRRTIELVADPEAGAAVRLIGEVEGLRTTGHDRWGLRWSELRGIAVTGGDAAGAPVRLLLALADPRLATGAVVVTDEPPFTHAYDIAAERDPAEVEREVTDLVRAFAPDLLARSADLGPAVPQASPAVRIPTPAPQVRPSGVSARTVRTSSRSLQLKVGAVVVPVFALGVLVMYASAFVDNPLAARLVGGALGLVFLLIGVAGLVTLFFDLTRRIVIDSDGMRLTHAGGWRFGWDEIAAVAITLSGAPGDAKAPVGIAVAAPRHEAGADVSYQAWDEVPPFTHLCPVRGGRDPEDLRSELQSALGAFVPDLYVGELNR
ncbi:hypothetical protein [Luteipulveratus halotolerans]|uniref:Uncharacterized protein n=1 Tax=Luteipulveratus halotolerans TaxID=1631356 RepID=A0A0L6CET4_9MICO|nr:hypothetical protein [Luteipulveratus halotolerans]KNX36003.1 hypothetical protein VV01_00670 [Luteipulveratus halotolerans]